MSQIQRYQIRISADGQVAEKSADGEWVKYPDHLAAVAAKDAEIAQLQQPYYDDSNDRQR